MISVIVVGSGNVASSFCGLVHQSKELVLVAILARNERKGQELAALYGTSYQSITSQGFPEADLVIIAVSDAAVTEVAGVNFPGNPILVHTAGAISKEVLLPFAKEYGVLYPLQSLSKKDKNVNEIPILFDGNTKIVSTKLGSIAAQLSNIYFEVSDENRLRYHLSAVFVNNFSNYLFTLAYEYCVKNNLDFSLLLPLLKATAMKVTATSPAALQTGPAVRKDKATIDKHLELLEGEEEMRRVYELFTRMIKKEAN